MNLQSEILKEHSKRQVVKIARWIGSNPNRFKLLMDLFLNGEPIVTQRSAWIVGILGEKYPELIPPWLPAMLKKMQEPAVHCAVKRNVTRTLRYIEIPRKHLGKVVTICFDEIANPSSPVAIRAFSMYVLARIAKQEPAIINELRVTIEQLLPYAGGGLLACSRKVLKQIDKMKKVAV
ncbi:MAG: hypothetical protein HZB59_04740 [Ignavibacteriales bacterium]|nr:hypothetical protein [Ignavibacteriales bacterium]